MNKDGFTDYVIGMPYDGYGRASVFSGKDGNRLAPLLAAFRAERFGSAVAGIGDINGDGFADVAVGAPDESAGTVRIYSGRSFPASTTLYVLKGDTQATVFGWAVSAAGDVDRDGIPDILIGAPGNTSPVAKSGQVRIISGATGKPIWTFTGPAGSQPGFAVSGAGDVNSDGYADVIVGSSADFATVFSGKDGKQLYTFTGDTPGDHFGRSVSGAGDVDGDGFDDLIVGAPFDDNNGADSGSARVFSGKDGKILYTFNGDAAGNYFGHAVDGIGDVDGDGFDDIVVGIPRSARNGFMSGSVRVFSGKSGKEIVTLNGETSNHQFGYSVASAGTGNIIVGTPYYDHPTVFNIGRAQVFSGIGFHTFGSGCSSLTKLPSLRLTSPAKMGRKFGIAVDNLLSLKPGVVVVGLSDKTWNTTPLPLDLKLMGMDGCKLYIDWLAEIPIWSGSGTAQLNVEVPIIPGLAGLPILNQAWIIDPAANSLGVATSNASRIVVGG